MAWHEHADGCGPTVLTGYVQACPQKQAWLQNWNVPAGREQPPVIRTGPTVSALSFRKSTQAEQQCLRPPVDIPCPVPDPEDVKPQLVHGRWRWAVQAEVCPGAWLLPPCSSELGNSTTVSAQSGTGHVARWPWGVTWLTSVNALKLCLYRLKTWGELVFPVNTNRFCWRKKGTGHTLAIH